MNADFISDIEQCEVGRALGYDLYRFGVRVAQPDWPECIGEGIRLAHSRQIVPCTAGRYQRKWLQLRLNALKRQRIVDPAVTPLLLQQIDVVNCPVTRELLTHGARQPSDWSIDRLNNDGAYAPYNLAVMSTFANRAKASRSFDEVLALAHSGGGGQLPPVQWLRLASLMLGPCFAQKPHDAPLLPLLAPVQRRAAIDSVQLVQYVFTLQSARPAEKNRLVKHFGRICPDAIGKRRLCTLAELVHLRLKQVECAWDVWLGDGVMEALSGWRSVMPASAWAQAAHISMHLAGSRQVSHRALQAFQVTTHGRYAVSFA